MDTLTIIDNFGGGIVGTAKVPTTQEELATLQALYKSTSVILKRKTNGMVTFLSDVKLNRIGWYQ